jgi:hypothetical protein
VCAGERNSRDKQARSGGYEPPSADSQMSATERAEQLQEYFRGVVKRVEK